VPAVVVVLVVASPLHALEEMTAEEDVAELLATPPEAEEGEHEGRQWAVLPQVGYGPDTGPVGGAKFTHRNHAGLGLTLDLDGTYALEKQQSFSFGIGSPRLFDDRMLIFLRSAYDLDPQMEFFGLGNNDVGPDPASTHSLQEADGFLIVGWRPGRRLALNFGVGLRHVRIGHGDRDGDTPFTLDAFPNLPGIDGGMVNPFELSLVYTSRDSVVRPRGARAILKVSRTDHSVLSDFEFTRLLVDLSYWLRFGGDRHALGARLNGGFIFGPDRDIPFWELEELGGDDTLRGFYPQRFRGSQRVLVNFEYNLRFGSFDFFDWWHVVVEGAAFGGGGRVFLSNDELRDEFAFDEDLIDRVVSDFQYSYGGGLRFALSQALVARIDVGFSEEETGLVYLAFGHAF
jgi:outer membrane protein assembly factor BamA